MRRLLLHTEVNDGAVIPIWEDVRPGDVAVLKEVMKSRRAHPSSEGLPPLEVSYARVPITAEHPPDFSDFGALIALALSTDMASTPIVLNDQLGRGRASLAAVILVLVQNWLHRDRERAHFFNLMKAICSSSPHCHGTFPVNLSNGRQILPKSLMNRR